MTSEVLIATPNSLVLASDGVVTVKGRKTFTGVHKLSILSEDPTIVIMYYGKPDIGLVDMNSSINEFKKQNRDKNFSNIKEVSEELIAFLEEYTYSDDVKSIVKYYFELFKTDLKRDFQYMDEELFWDYINECDKSETYPFIEYLSFRDILPFDVQDIDEANDELLKIFSNYLSDSGTNIVIAGFDKDNNRPSFIHIGLIFNNDGTIEHKIFDFAENFQGTEIISFAHDDEINTFIRGINPDLEFSIINYVNLMLKLQLDDFYQGLVDSGDFDDEVLEKIGEHVAIGIELVNNENLFIKQVNQWKKKNYDSFLEIIAFLPNHILAEFARFLISIVSSRRKFSLDLENVGGEIDVCIVTKNQILLNE